MNRSDPRLVKRLRVFVSASAVFSVVVGLSGLFGVDTSYRKPAHLEGRAINDEGEHRCLLRTDGHFPVGC